MIHENLIQIRQRIATACSRCGREPDKIAIVAVTKTVTSDIVEAAITAGITIIGENRVQEAEQKQAAVRGKAQWHMIGHLQTNKVRKALQIFDVIQSVDSPHLGEKLQLECEKLGKTIDILLQVNTSGEESKFGVEPAKTVAVTQEIAAFPALHIQGLMTIGAFVADATRVRNCFVTLRELAEEIKSASIADVAMRYLSMGMSDDFEIAIEEGANMLRLGRVLFGERREGI